MEPHQHLDDAWLQQHYERLCRSAWLLVGRIDEAEELVQESLVIALESIHRFRGDSELYTWVYAIMLRVQRNRQRSWVRARNRIQRWWEGRQANLSCKQDDPAVGYAQSLWKDSLWSSVAKLPNEQQQAVVMRFGDDMSCSAIAKVLNCPEGTVRSRLHYALVAIRKQCMDCDETPSTTETLESLKFAATILPKQVM